MMAATGSCETESCSEFEVSKDFSMMPPGFSPVLCGVCNEEIEVSEEEPPDEIDNTLPTP